MYVLFVNVQQNEIAAKDVLILSSVPQQYTADQSDDEGRSHITGDGNDPRDKAGGVALGSDECAAVLHQWHKKLARTNPGEPPAPVEDLKLLHTQLFQGKPLTTSILRRSTAGDGDSKEDVIESMSADDATSEHSTDPTPAAAVGIRFWLVKKFDYM